ncbi:hypothetical protein H310_04670 [Aphanomyces invadans]|uniref:Uncharacterized protein n=1 Tax=Aphanomyces invadans TaxID=157072 RepID=A0A024UDV8_9STRA|nr:hypothetical protein H310_04670 [Aphanomyces invadans]ETW04385.1 hypothetical protein H310_04670 [Aphanomyces invadans]|eukprot:XP_008867341.1 hypothetical protein H310_04670 [Aphanomyces invadans]
MRRRSTNNGGGAHGVLTRSRKKLMELQGYLAKERVIDDVELDEYINRLDEKIDAMHDVMTWGDHDDDSGVTDDDDSDSDEDSDYNPNRSSKATSSRPGFVSHVFWSSVGPGLVLPVLYHRWSYSSYPLSSSSVFSYLAKVFVNWASVVLLVCLSFAGVCHTRQFLQGSLFKVPSEAQTCAFHIWHTLLNCVDKYGRECYTTSDCQFPLGQVVGALVGLALVARFYLRRVQIVLAALFLVHHGLQQWTTHLSVILDTAATFHARSIVHIASIDPTFAYMNEPIHILLDGHNLHEGMLVGWVPYWSCSREAAVLSDCPVDLVAPMKHGGVTQTFPAVDEYTVCVDKSATAPAALSSPTPSFACFPEVRLKVKHAQSNPGWSLHHQ